MNIGIDIDDTLSKTTEYLYDKAIDFTKNVLKREPVINKEEKFPRCLGWSNEEVVKFFNGVFDKEVLNIPPFEEAKKYLQKLKEDGHKIFIITARDSIHLTNPYEKCLKWLEKNDIPFDKLIVGSKYKSEVCQKERISIMIDDSFNQCSYIADHLKIKVLMMATFNNNIVYKGITRVNNWSEIYHLIAKDKRV